MLPIAQCILVIALGTSIRAQGEKVDVEALRKQYASSCAPSSSSDACKKMRWKLEDVLYVDLLLSMQDGETPPPSAIEVGLAAETPRLRALALQLAPQGPARTSAAVAALDSPYATVREEAAAILRSSGDEKQRRMLDRQASGKRPEYPVADAQPDPARLKAKVYPGATYRYFASGPEEAYFSTSDSPDKVVAFYTQGGQKAYSASELKQAMKSRATSAAMDQSKMMQVIQEAQKKGQDPAQAMMAWQKSFSGLGSDPTRNFEGKQGVVSPRYIPADDMFSRVVVVFRDDLVGATAIAVPLPPLAADAPMPTGNDVMKSVARQQYMHQPIIDTPPAGD